MTKLTDLSIKEALNALKKGEFTAEELTKAHIVQASKHKELKVFVTETFDFAINQAKEADARIKSGSMKALDGIPMAVKDLFATKGIKTTSCSKILDNFVPTYESTVSSNLSRNGGIMLGKTNMDEFAMGSSNLTSFYGPVKNPWKRKSDNADLVPGGSSGGSASAVASNIVMGALGSDTGGSIRQPAAFCGIVGMKPTYGRCSRYGMFAFASSLDQAGVFSKNVEDTAIMLEAIMGYDKKDSTSINKAIPSLQSLLNQNAKGLRVGIPKEYYAEGMSEEIAKIWQEGARILKEQGAEIIDISLPHTKYALPTYYIIAPAECSSNLARYDGVRYGLRIGEQNISLDEMYEMTRGEGFGREVKRRIMIGTYVLSAGYFDSYYTKAQKVRALIANDFTESFKKVDVILTPTAPSDAFAFNEKQDPITMYLNDVFTVPASLAGLPCISIPAGLSQKGLPLGLQLIGNLFKEDDVIKSASALEKGLNFNFKPDGI